MSNILTHHNDNARTGLNSSETRLNTFNVNARRFGRLPYSYSVSGQIYAQPLYMSGVSIPGQGVRNVIFVATEMNSVYAFDADGPTLFWHTDLLASHPPGVVVTSVPFSEVAQGDPDHRLLFPVIGITSTPVIDPASGGTIYLVAKTKEVSGGTRSYVQRLHALDIVTGTEKFGGPHLIGLSRQGVNDQDDRNLVNESEASVPGGGLGSVNGQIIFNAKSHLQRPALLLLNGIVYIAWGSHADILPYHGWLLGYDARTLRLVATYNTTPDGPEGAGAIWQSGAGPAADENGNIYVMTGNGNFTQDGRNLANSFVKLATRPQPFSGGPDWFTPFNEAELNAGDFDLGSSGPLLPPGTPLLVGGGKEGKLYVLDRTRRPNLGHFNNGSDSQIAQSFQATDHPFDHHIHGSPVCWQSPTHGLLLYVWAENEHLKAFRFANGRFDPTTPIAQSKMSVTNGMPGGMLSLSANGSTPGSGIVWVSHPYDQDATTQTVAGILRAFDADDISRELWNSKMNVARDDVGTFAKFCPLTIANGKVYAATFSDQLVVYGHLPTGSGFLIQGTFGLPRDQTSPIPQKGNFELVVPLTVAGLGHFYRDNENEDEWQKNPQFPFGAELGQIGAVSLIQSNFSQKGNGPGNLELVARSGDRLRYFLFTDGGGPNDTPGPWGTPAGADLNVDGMPITGVSGTPALIQSLNGTMGNFELVVPLATGGLGHFLRDNDNASDIKNNRWQKNPQFLFGAELGQVDAVSLIQSNFSQKGNGPGNLELVARVQDRLHYFLRPDGGGPNDTAGPWGTPPGADLNVDGAPIIGVSGTPSFIQGRYGVKGNFELVVPLATGGLGHFFRDNDNAADINNNRWQKNLQFPFGAELGQIDAVSLIQSSFSAQGNGPGNLGLVARVRNRLYYFFKPDAAPGLWQGPFIFAIDV